MECELDLDRAVRAARALLNLSQEELAQKADVSRSVIARVERNDKTVTLDTTDKILRTLERCGVVFIAPQDGTTTGLALRVIT